MLRLRRTKTFGGLPVSWLAVGQPFTTSSSTRRATFCKVLASSQVAVSPTSQPVGLWFNVFGQDKLLHCQERFSLAIMANLALRCVSVQQPPRTYSICFGKLSGGGGQTRSGREVRKSGLSRVRSSGTVDEMGVLLSCGALLWCTQNS